MDERDPFTSAPSGHTHYRFGNFDSQTFALGPGVSADQAKRALEAHLAETDRRMEEAGKVGAALVEQHKTLTEKLKEVEKLQAEDELSPELRQKLVEIEKDYTDVARESARVFMPKSRVPSNETVVAGSPFAPEGKGGRRSVSPSKFESHGTGSPTKLTVPNRKLRNQPSNRVHDIEFAAEISTSLIAQVRSLQSLLAEKEEEVRDLKVEKSQLEIEAEGFQQRIKTLDESEHRYKDENWNLETQIRELLASQKDAADREKKLGQNLTILQAEKNAALRELDEVKLAHAKLTEEHAAAAKHHDVELGAAKRNIAMAENERSVMQRKLDDLTNQNQELAKAFSMQRGRTLERDGQSGLSDEDFETATDNMTPEHSPPPSPIKGTPRHSMLESETLRTSFQHLQRQLQLMRTNLHREKTEKLELRRILQESRDEVERLRLKGEPGSAQTKRSKKIDTKDQKKPRPNQLGALRIPRNEVFMDDPDWEDAADSPSRSTPRISPISRGSRGSGEALAFRAVAATSESETFETANETSDAFETANERAGTETDDFQTGAEEFSGEDTETESLTRGTGRRPSAVPVGLGQRGRGKSFHSTASTSAEEDEYPTTELRTPTVFPVPHKMRLKVSRGAISRRSRHASEEPPLASSPASFGGSIDGTPQVQQSLFAELGDLEGSDDDLINTPSRRSVRSMTPASIVRERTASPPPAMPPMPKVMVDVGSQTEPLAELVEPKLSLTHSGIGTELIDSESLPTSPASVVTAQRPRTMESVLDATEASKRLTVGTIDSELSRPLSSVYSDSGAQYDPDIERKLSLFPAPPLAHPTILPPLQTLVMSSVEPIIDIEPIIQNEKPAPELVLSGIVSEEVAPVAEVPPPLELSMSAIASEAVEPEAEPEVPPPSLTVSEVLSEHVEPLSEPAPEPPALTVSEVLFEHVEPLSEAAPEPPALSLSMLVSENVEPIAEPEITPPPLSISKVVMEEVSPVAALEPPKPDAPELSLSLMASQGIEPVEVPPPALTMSGVVTEGVEPIAPVEPTLQLSAILSHGVEPSTPESPILAISPLIFEVVEPVEVQPAVPQLSLSTMVSECLTPVSRPATPKPDLTISAIQAQAVSPVSPPVQRPITPPLAFSSVETMASTSPVSPRSPKRDGFIIPRDFDGKEVDEPHTPSEGLFNVFRNRKELATPIIAEDETRQSLNNTPQIETPESQRPLKEMDNNSPVRPPRKAPTPMITLIDNGAQTTLTAEELDKLIAARASGPLTPEKGALGLGALAGNLGNTPSTVRRRQSEESVGSVIHHKGKEVDGEYVLIENLHHRPGSSASARAGFDDVPPLPPNHRQVIEAARTGSSHGGTGTMGPPLLPASAFRNPALRPRTPTSPSKGMSATVSGRGTPTPRAGGVGPSHGTARVGSPSRLTDRSRQSSVTSFASELDSRFHLQNGITPQGFAPGTDPRMIQAITQTMIGEYLWKYTRKTASSNMSQTRHRRYFWVHPYTRTLYWSDRDPSMPGSRAEGRTKSVQIEAVRVVTDDNPYPPGLHRKSLVVIAPGRAVKFTCPTGQRHETWFNALSYLLLRTNDRHNDTEQLAENITQEDVDEFNPGYNQRRPNGNRLRAPPSLSSYNSRPSGTTSPAVDMSMNVPTLTPTHAQRQATQRPSIGSLSSRISGYWKAGNFSSLRTRNAMAQSPSIYEASEVHDSAEDLRQIIEQQDREADRLENVRACCDGKHDVGTLTNTKRSRPHAHHAHSHPGNTSTTNTPMGTLRSRA